MAKLSLFFSDITIIGPMLLGGLNSVAAVVEAGIEISSVAENRLVEFEQLTSFWNLR
ncbi:hypothetical protein ACFLXF_01780 [Chloroflexota bacterium]